MPKLSIIVPIYNVENFLGKCLDSILQQSYKDFEVILVDDGSSDKCPSICKQYAQKDYRINIIRQRNQGVSSARNVGINYAKGDYIGFVDPDDIIEPNMYEVLMKAATQFQPDIVVCSIKTHNFITNTHSVSEVWKDVNCIVNSLVIRDEIMPNILNGKRYSLLSSCNKLYKRSCFENSYVRFDENRNHGEDARLNLILLTMITKMVFIDQPLYNYLVYDRKSLTQLFREDLYKYILDNKNFGKYLCEKYNLKQSIQKIENDYIIATIDYMQSIVQSGLSNSQKFKLLEDIMLDDDFKYFISNCPSPSYYYALLKILSKRKVPFFFYLVVKIKSRFQNYLHKGG